MCNGHVFSNPPKRAVKTPVDVLELYSRRQARLNEADRAADATRGR